MEPEGSQLIQDLEDVALRVRRLIIEIAYNSRGIHIASCLSCVDLLVALYFKILRINKEDWESRDIFILSKAHAALALYSVLTAKGFMDQQFLLGFFQNNGTLPAHLDRFSAKPIEVSAGSLAHGFNMAIGMAYGYRIKGDNRKVFTLIGDGESQEGSIWEGASFAAKFGLDNLTAILDYNNLQGYGRPRELCYYEPVEEKWRAFGWEVYHADGHDFSQILKALECSHNGRPKIIIACTIKGKGVAFMEDEIKWHYFIVTEELKNLALQELE